MRLGKKLVTLGMVACLSVASSMIAFASETPAITFFGQQPVADYEGDYMTSYKVIVAGKNTLSRSDFEIETGNGWSAPYLDNMADRQLVSIFSDEGDFFQLTNEETEKVQKFMLYYLPDGTPVESLGEDAKYIIYANGSTTSPVETGKWVENGTGWWYDNGDGTYPTNTWKVINNVYYYFGADGYMLTNTTTPDGYTVNADGVWVQ